MNYKIATLSIFVVLMLLTIYLVFSEPVYGLAIMALVVPALTILQVYVVLTAKKPRPMDFTGGNYEHD